MILEKYDDDDKKKERSKKYNVTKKTNRYFSLPVYYVEWLYVFAKKESRKNTTTKAGITKFVIDALNSKNKSRQYVFPKNVELKKIKIYIPDFLYSSIKIYSRRLKISRSKFIAYNVISYIDDFCKTNNELTPHDLYFLKKLQ